MTVLARPIILRKITYKQSIRRGVVHAMHNPSMHCMDIQESLIQGLSQDLETGCPELPIIKLRGILFLKGDHSLYSDYNHECIFPYWTSTSKHPRSRHHLLCTHTFPLNRATLLADTKTYTLASVLCYYHLKRFPDLHKS